MMILKAIAAGFCGVLALMIVALSCYFVHAACRMMREEVERERMERMLRSARATDRQLERLRKHGMKAKYRRARVW